MKKSLRACCLALIFHFLLVSCGEKAKEEKTSADSNAVETVKPDSSAATVQEEKIIKALPQPDKSPIEFITETIAHPNGDTFQLKIPKGFGIRIAASGMNRIRFMDMSPDGRLFLTDMFNLEDNSKGKIYVLDEYNDSTMTFNKKITYLDKLRNPNSLAFYKDAADKTWLYIALTDKLIRYQYEQGSTQPSPAPEVIDTYPDYGLSYRYGGWHLTRTIRFGDNGKLYVAVGSSCNACVEKEEIRACVVEMDPDGKNRKVFARGLRNAVGLEWAEGNLYCSNMAADHLGKDKPDDCMFRVDQNKNYGWPWCYHWNGQAYDDPKFDSARAVSAKEVPSAFAYLGAHAAPLGLSWFGEDRASDNSLRNYFIVALHGSYSPSIGRGYSLQRVRALDYPEDFISGFLDKNNKVHGRPCGIFPAGKDRFYFTDDKFGTLYLVYKKQ
jgi:glucose/arabinose dehydrogenase